jgi:hypothetical protein
MKYSGATDVVVDFLVPARLASRYRASVTAISPLEAELRFAFCPSIFASGVLVSCPAAMLVVVGREVVGARGILWMEPAMKRTVGRFQFESPMAAPDLERVRHLCHIEEETLVEPVLDVVAEHLH